MSREQIIADTFAAIDKSLKKASIAQIGGFRPPESAVVSWFGGRFVGKPGEEWPVYKDKPMLPLLQVRTDELPYQPDALKGIALFNVFASKKPPTDTPAPSGKRWLIRTYPTLDGLVELKAPESKLKPFPVRWSLSETEAPSWDDAWDVTDLTAFNDLDGASELFGNHYNQHAATKIGGWPSYIQGKPNEDMDGFVFQIGSEEKPQWTWGDGGNGYFYLQDGEWLMHWDCY